MFDRVSQALGGGQMIQQRQPYSRGVAQALAQSAFSNDPIETPIEGVGRLAQLYGLKNMERSRMESADEERAAQMERYSKIAEALGGSDPRLQALISSGDPDLAKIGVSQAFEKPKSDEYQLTEIYDDAGRPQKVRYNKRTGEYQPIGGAKAPSGTQLRVNPETGEVEFMQGAGMKPLTEGQSKDTVFATRAAGAMPILDENENALTNLGESVGSSVPVVGNYLRSEEYQKAEQAGLEFLQAILRKDTGAAITSQEQTEYGRVYLPQPGDGPEVIRQKRESRARALEAIKAGMPPQAILAQENALRTPSRQNGETSAPGIPDGIDPSDWEFLTPEERALFQ